MSDDLSFLLHALVHRLDRSADRILRAELGVSYRRFLALFMIRDLGASTQRALAERLDVSEPAISRMTAVLSEAGLLSAESDPAGGNRRVLRLTAAGDRLVDSGRTLLSQRFEALLQVGGIPVAAYARHTKRLLELLDDTDVDASAARSAAGAGR